MADLPTQNSYWSSTAEENLAALHSSPAGLSANEAGERLVKFGPNTIQTKKKASPFGLFLNQFKSPIILILLFATIVSAFLGDITDATIILVIVAGSAVLSFVQEYRASNAVEKLLSQVSVKIPVFRDGKEISIPSEQVVPGDVVHLSAGSLIPADGIVLEATDFFVNQAVLTGETFPVEKAPGVVKAASSLAERNNCVFMGTNVSSGTAKILVAQTGKSTAFGQIAQKLGTRPPETEFERGIRHFGMLLTEVMFILVLAIFAFNVIFHKPILDSLLFSIALAVGLTPQLLPANININLSKGAQMMAKKGVIVRRLASIENFGSMDVLCTDKTGTLTIGVVKLDFALDVEGKASDHLFRLAYLNAHFQTGLANALDEAIQSHATVDVAGVEKVDEIPYDFVRKRLSVIVLEKETCTMITKGALKNILDICSQVTDGDKAVSLDAAHRDAIDKLYTDWSGQGYRILGVAEKPVEKKHPYSRDDEKDLIFSGFLLFFDPPKPDVKKAIIDLEKMGIQLKVITGDNKLVAMHLAEEIGMQVKGVVTGAEIAEMHEALAQRAENTTIFAEVDPNQKERIIQAIQRMGHVVGYMGDGVNDAPALHTADVGISVETAVDVAKQAADFVLSSADLGVLHQGIVGGRQTFANTLKYVFMATSANFGNMFSVAGAALFLPFLPMLPKQILLINFLTDLPEITIANDNVDAEFVQSPHRWDLHFIRRFMLIFGILSSVFDYATFGVLLLMLHSTPTLFRSGWFVESVLSASLVVFAIRTRLPFFKSRPSRLMAIVTACVAVVTLLIPYSPLNGLLNFQPMPLVYLLWIAAIVLVYFVSAEFLKRWFYRVTPLK
jgi:Mg2+-importing ATPase